MAIRFFDWRCHIRAGFLKKMKGVKKEKSLKGALLGSILYVAFALQTVGLEFTTPSKMLF